MRDAFGGAFMIQVFLVFILIYICFTAMSLNYAKAFKVKDGVIDYLENNEIADIQNINAKDMMTMTDYFNEEFVGKKGYNVSEYKVCDNITYNVKEKNYCHPSGIVITQTGKSTNTEGVYYTVSTYASWGVPFLNKLLQLNGNNKQEGVITGLWRISGQTRLIVNE